MYPVAVLAAAGPHNHNASAGSTDISDMWGFICILMNTHHSRRCLNTLYVYEVDWYVYEVEVGGWDVTIIT